MTAPTQQPESSTVRATVDLAVGEYRLQATVSVPAGPTSLRTMLPVVQSLADGLVSIGERAVQDKGKTVSCKKGCGACCRQLVPITEVEARRLADLVKEMPEPRRTQIQARFAEARRRLQESGMLQRLLHRTGWSGEEFQRIGLEYFYLGIPCPFLEEESCSIHPDRPITCREYLVTSPAENCCRPTARNIDWVPLAVKLWRELARFDKVEPGSPYLRWVPLILIPEWAEEHPDDLPPRPGPEWLRELFERLQAMVPAKEGASPLVPAAADERLA
jgi:Fe-S-cluster containining protein